MNTHSSSIPLENIARRQQALRKALQQRQLDALLIFSPENMRYITGYSGESACVVVGHDTCHLITDYRFSEQAQRECRQTQVIERDRERQTLGACLASLGTELHLENIGFESDKITVAEWQTLSLALNEIAPRPLAGCIEQLRKTKDAWEIQQLRAAADIGDRALASCLPLLSASMTEKGFAIALEHQLHLLGSEGLAFPTIAVFGENTSKPHGMPGNTALKAGDLITIDFGAVINGYRSDMTRSYVYGEPSARQMALFTTVHDAQTAALDCIKAGIDAKEVNQAAHGILKASPFHEYAGSGLGHGLGLYLHEFPHIGPNCQELLHQDFVVTVEPGIYIPGWGGLRLEDDILITKDGYELITHAPKIFRLPL